MRKEELSCFEDEEGRRGSGLRRKVSESKLPSTVRPTLLLLPLSERIQGAGAGRPYSRDVLVELLVVFSLPDQVYFKSRVDSLWHHNFHHHYFSGPTIANCLSMSSCCLTLCITLVFPHKNILPSLPPSLGVCDLSAARSRSQLVSRSPRAPQLEMIHI